MHRCFFFFHHIGLPLSFKDWAAPSSYISTPLAGAFGLQSSIFVLTNCQNKINLKVLAQDNLCCCPEQQQLMILSITIHHTSALTSYVDMASTSQFYCTDHTYIYILIYICWDIYIFWYWLMQAEFFKSSEIPSRKKVWGVQSQPSVEELFPPKVCKLLLVFLCGLLQKPLV